MRLLADKLGSPTPVMVLLAVAAMCFILSELGSARRRSVVTPARAPKTVNYEEELVLSFLKKYPETAFSRREIARKAVKRREFEADPEWANVAICTLLDRKEIEEDKAGCFRYKPKSHVW